MITVCLILDKGMKSLGQHKNNVPGSTQDIIIIINNIIKIKRMITVCLILDKGMKSLGQHKYIMSLGQLKIFHYYYCYYYYYYCCCCCC